MDNGSKVDIMDQRRLYPDSSAFLTWSVNMQKWNGTYMYLWQMIYMQFIFIIRVIDKAIAMGLKIQLTIQL